MRKAARAARRRARIAAPDAANQVRDRFLEAIPVQPGVCIAGYVALRSELDPAPLLEALHQRGARCALPVVTDPTTPLVFRAWCPGDPLIEGAFRTRIPTPEAPEVIPEIVLVPLLAFDGDGGRLGYGGGYYDRSLAGLPGTLAVGLAFEAQRVDRVPMGPMDESLDLVVTELSVHRLSDRGLVWNEPSGPPTIR
jgi:5-formyltetrahydrofolate cyclo-ligase